MPNSLTDIEDQVDARLKELEPLVEEYQRLLEVARTLRAKKAPEPGAARRRSRVASDDPEPSPTTRRSGRGAAKKRAPRGENRDRILALVSKRPGISNREIADETGIGRRVVATAVSKYKRDGLLVSDGDGVKIGDNVTA